VADIDARLHLLTDKPMLICWGGRDFCFHDRFLREWQRRFPHAETHRFADAGHYILEDKGDAVLALVQSFLAGKTEPVPATD
jgi:haloalkane dehalogenase